jgi:hypothetical protein
MQKLCLELLFFKRLKMMKLERKSKKMTSPFAIYVPTRTKVRKLSIKIMERKRKKRKINY